MSEERPAWRRWARYAAYILGGKVAFWLLLLVVLQTPPVSDWIVTAGINAVGYGPAKIQGAHVGFTGARIASGTLGKPGADVQFKDLSLTYGFPFGLGGVKSVQAKWLFAKATFADGKLTLPLVKPSAAPGMTKAQATNKSLPRLPRIEIEQLWMIASGFDTAIAASGSFSLAASVAKPSTYDAAFNGSLGSARGTRAGTLTAEIASSDSVNVSAEFTKDGPPLPPILASASTKGPLIGFLDARASVSRGALDSLAVDAILEKGFGPIQFDTLEVNGETRTGYGVLWIKAPEDACNYDLAWLRSALKKSAPFLAAPAVAPFTDEIFSQADGRCVLKGEARFAFAAANREVLPSRLSLDVYKGVDPPAQPSLSPAEKLRTASESPAEVSAGPNLLVAIHGRRFTMSAGGQVIFGDAEHGARPNSDRFTILGPYAHLPTSSVSLDATANSVRHDAATGWTADAARLSLDGALGQSSAKNLIFEFSGDATPAGSAWKITPSDGCVRATFDAAGTAGISAHAGEARVCAAQSQPLAVIDPKGAVPLSAHGHYALEPRSVSVGTTSASGKFPDGAFNLTVAKGGAVHLDAGVAAGPLAVRSGKDEGVRVASLAADTVIDIGAGGLTLSTPDIVARIEDAAKATRFAPVAVTGALSASAGKLQGAFEGTALGQHLLTASLAHDLSSGAGALTFDSGALTFASGGTQLQKLLPLLMGKIIAAQGTARAQGAFNWRRGGAVTSNGDVLLKGFGFTMQYGRVQGIDGDFKLSSLAPPKTPAAQAFKIAKMNVGLPLANGEVKIALPGDGSVQLPSAIWPWAGGALAIVDGAFVPGAAVQHVTMTAREIDLTQLFKLVAIDGLSGSGVVDGRLPIEVRDKDAFLIAGAFKARAPGVLSYTGKDLPSASDANASLLFTALQDFHYETLEATVDGPLTGEITVGLHLKGSNPKVYNGYPFALNISIKAKLANLLLDTTQGLRIPQEIKDQLGKAH